MLRPPLLLAALFLSSSALSATEAVPLEVSLTVRESCLVEQGDTSPLQAPTVNCALDSPYRVRGAAAERPASHGKPPMKTARPEPALWEVTF